jgi:hypothetical protein
MGRDSETGIFGSLILHIGRTMGIGVRLLGKKKYREQSGMEAAGSFQKDLAPKS